eukprot:4593629-Amphidinium_carterae.1
MFKGGLGVEVFTRLSANVVPKLNSNMRHTSPGTRNRAPHDPTSPSTAPSVYMMTSGPTGEKGTSPGSSNGKVMAIASTATASSNFSKLNLLHGPPAAVPQLVHAPST